MEEKVENKQTEEAVITETQEATAETHEAKAETEATAETEAKAETEATAETAKTEKPHKKKKSQNKFVGAFDKFFKFTERGSSMSKEIWGGVSSFLVSICIIFMNISIIGKLTIAPSVSISDGTGFYTGIYLATMICTLIGTLLIGLLCNLPFVQSAGLGLTSAFIAIAGGEGLTFANVLAVTFISAAVFTIVCATPIKKYIYGALPAGVKKAMPIVVGVFILIMFLTCAAGGNPASVNGVRDIFSLGSFAKEKVGIVCVVSIAVTLVVGIVLKALGKKGIFKVCLLIGIIVYYLLGCILCFTDVVGQDRVFLIVDAYGSYNIGTAIENGNMYNFFKVFTSGFDFTAYTAAGGNVALLFVQGILTFLMLGCYDSAGVMQASATHSGLEASDKHLTRALLINGGTNVLGAMLGSAPVSVSAASSVASDEGAKTGLSSVVCCIGYFISIFTWLVPALLASTLGISVDYGHAEFGIYTQATFRVVFAAAAIVGLSMVMKSIRKLALENRTETLVVVATVLASAFTVNISIGIAVGVVIDLLAKLVGRKWKKFSIPEIVVGVLLLLCLALGLFF